MAISLKAKAILDEYNENIETFKLMREVILDSLSEISNSIVLNCKEARVKTFKSLSGKLELKGDKYSSLKDITDIVGARIVCFYEDDIDKIAALVVSKFDVDWENSVDKRKIYKEDEFGYMSLHYICRIPKELCFDENHQDLNEYRFEIQIRTTLQHAWASIFHDTGYKNDVEVPYEYLRSLNRLAGLLELADQEFVSIRKQLNDYKTKIKQVVASGDLGEATLNKDSFLAYIETNEFDKLNERIASFNNMEIVPASFMPYLHVLKRLGFKTLQEVHDLVINYSDRAYSFTLKQMSGLDIDIVSRTVGINALITVYIIANNLGVGVLNRVLDMLNGVSSSNSRRAKKLFDLGREMGLIN